MEKIGIIDLGSNTARLVIVEMLGDGHFIVIDQLKESVRLGKDMERDGFLKPQRIAETLKTLKMFRKLCDAYGIEKIIAVATAAVRRAKNQRSFLDEVATTCGIKLRVLTADEEATYVYKGVINTMDIPKGLILEIGGGSTKIVQYNRKNLLHYETLPFGAVTLTELFQNDGISPAEQAAKIEEFFTEQLKKIEWLKDVDPETQMIGVGGSFRSLCKLSKRFYNCNQKHVEHVVNLSVQLFKQLRVLHKFPRQYLKILKVVAMLHDSGASIKYYNYEKHTAYIILNASIYGLTTREMVMASLVAAVHANDDVNMSDFVRYKAYVSEEDVDAIRKLGIMLRIAESLDRSMSSCVVSLNCDVLGDSVIMKTEVEGDASLEIKDALNAYSDFRRIFHKNLEIL